MPDTSQLLTNEPFANENNTNKFILNFSRSDCITKKIITNKDKKKKKKKDKEEKRIKKRENINLTPHRCERGVRA